MSWVRYSSTSPPPRSRASSEKIRRLPRRSRTSSARSPRTPPSPVIVYMDDAHEYMVGKKFDKTGPGRFCKEFQTTRKVFHAKKERRHLHGLGQKRPAAVPPDDKNCPNGTFDARILFIGCTSEPEKADPKATKAFFDRMFVLPLPRPRVALHALEADHRGAAEGLSGHQCGRSINPSPRERRILGGRYHFLREKTLRRSDGWNG